MEQHEPASQPGGVNESEHQVCHTASLNDVACLRVKHALLIGAVCAVIAGPAVYFGLGTQYRCSALIKVAAAREAIVDEARPTTQRVYDIKKETQMQRISQDDILMDALGKEDVRNLKCVARERKSGSDVNWLKEELTIVSDDSELIQVSLEGPDAEEITTLLNAVVQSYWFEVSERERLNMEKRLTTLEQARFKTETEARTKLDELKRLAKKHGELEQPPEAESSKAEMMKLDIENLQRLLSTLSEKIDQMEIDKHASPQIELLQAALRPEEPSNTKSRLGWAALATVVGLFGPLLCFLCWRVIRRTVLSLANL